jgi:hypothetical protein
MIEFASLAEFTPEGEPDDDRPNWGVCCDDIPDEKIPKDDRVRLARRIYPPRANQMTSAIATMARMMATNARALHAGGRRLAIGTP